ncbi:Mediator of RNA polymerase II transcription subunit 17 [Candida viswanathii]|uniref:Mediator of RNA polymerase II transcription subunit 17 n=1 Tax=Candida viswanathii TaxID=5486 RepID=A0A367Y4T2_9ASCO|nr:Mediator of RNA polymerase II transcription subunit 17 [Candida viswanathii]
MTDRQFNIDLELNQGDHIDPFIQDEDKLKLEELIPRILIERKSFLNVTEDSLRKEIDNEEASEAAVETDVPAIEVPLEEEEEDQQEVFNKQKFELSKNINYALNETQLSLDFVSLLISSVKPNLAKSTISPHLSKFVKPTSLNSDRLGQEGNEENNNTANSQQNSNVGQGWKLQSLNKITDLFREASVNLNDQVIKERRYWNMINLVLANDEALFRMRDPENNARAIGVKYGYGDSGSNFHDQGLALLRKDNQTGEISFHPITSLNNAKIVGKINKFIRVKILSQIDGDYMLTGQSVFQFDYKKSKQSIINDIEKARFFLFEEDLFYQLIREAKLLINYNVSIISNKIIIEINNTIIEIESIIYDELNEEDLENYYQNISEYSSLNNKKCQLILNYLKLMLCCYYKYNLKLKQKVPTSLTKWKQNNSHPLILRPLVGNMRHELNLSNMESILKGLVSKFGDKLKKTKMNVDKFTNLATRSKKLNPFQKSIEKPVSKFALVLENGASNILVVNVTLTTNELFVNLIIHLKIIRFNTVQDFENNVNGVNVLQLGFSDFNEIEECLDWSIQIFV